MVKSNTLYALTLTNNKTKNGINQCTDNNENIYDLINHQNQTN